MVEVKVAAKSAARKKKVTVRKKAVGKRKTASKVAGKKPVAAKKAAKKSRSRAIMTSDVRHRMVAEVAFLIAERRGFQGGDSIRDWLAAEKEVDGSLTD